MIANTFLRKTDGRTGEIGRLLYEIWLHSCEIGPLLGEFDRLSNKIDSLSGEIDSLSYKIEARGGISGLCVRILSLHLYFVREMKAFTLTNTGSAEDDQTLLAATNASGIVASDDGAAWAGCSDLVLPFG